CSTITATPTAKNTQIKSHETPCSTSRPYTSRLTRSSSIVDSRCIRAKRPRSATPLASDERRSRPNAAGYRGGLRIADRARDEVLQQRDLEVVVVQRRRAPHRALAREPRGLLGLRLTGHDLLDGGQPPRDALHRSGHDPDPLDRVAVREHRRRDVHEREVP